MKQSYKVRAIAFVLTILATNARGEAQGFTVSGRLKDAEGASFVQGATISLKSIRDTSIAFTSYSDTAGHFQFDAVAADSFRLMVSSVGFEKFSQIVRVEADDVPLGVLSLSRSSK
ncbi:MAG TPA: carboxypeptidase-like regulatory domain-containing protein, partial [Flavisolibacter sp.]|nr:carboxypeptidase-like regulatory domain-containing protein [Flavisolibacter sp.]